MPLGGCLGPAPYLEAQQDAEVPGGHVLDLVEHVELLPGWGGDGIHRGALAWGDTAEGAALSPLPAPREPSGMGTEPWGLGAHPAHPVGTRGAGGDAGEGWAGVLAGRERQQAGQRPAGRAMGTGQWPPGDTGDAGTSPGHPRQGCGPPALRAGVAAGASQVHKPHWGSHRAGGGLQHPMGTGKVASPCCSIPPCPRCVPLVLGFTDLPQPPPPNPLPPASSSPPRGGCYLGCHLPSASCPPQCPRRWGQGEGGQGQSRGHLGLGLGQVSRVGPHPGRRRDVTARCLLWRRGGL